MAELPLTNGGCALIDDEDYESVSVFSWKGRKKGHVTYAVPTSASYRRGAPTGLHRLILNAEKGQKVDHINGDGLDNRKSNLRFATDSQNQQNRKNLTTNTSGFRGVTFHRQAGKWQAAIKVTRNVYLGLYGTPEEAAQAYNEKATELYGRFANLNVIPEKDGVTPSKDEEAA